MKIERFEWEGDSTAVDVRVWCLDEASGANVGGDVEEIDAAFRDSDDKDALLLELTARFDATEAQRDSLRVEESAVEAALAAVDPELREAMEVAAANIRLVAEAQLSGSPETIRLPQGQSVTLREVPVSAAGIYAPGGRAAYPSTVLMCAIPARAAGVERIALATPPGPKGEVNSSVLAAAALCDVDEVYAVGGAQAIFAFAYGSATIASVDVVAGPGNAWVREAKARVSPIVGIDSLAGPSELMVVLDRDSDIAWAALDLCAQAEHGGDGPLVAASADPEVLDALVGEFERLAADVPGAQEAPLAIVRVPDVGKAIGFANAFCPEHLQLMVADGASLAAGVTTAGCVFVGRYSATAFGDYAAGSNHVLPTEGAGRFSGPLGPDTFRRKIATVEVPAGAAAKLAPHVKALAEAEGFPVHGESAMIRAEDPQ